MVYRGGLCVALMLLLSMNAQAFTAELDLGDLIYFNGGDGSVGFIINGIEDNELSGWQARAAGDINGDGIDDLIMGASHASPGGRSRAGRAYVVFGSATPFSTLFEASSLLMSSGGDGTLGFVVNGRFAGNELGTSVGAAGDVNGDGVDDIIVGAPDYSSFAGHAYVIFGSDQGLPPEIEVADLYAENGGDGTLGFVLSGVDPFSRNGWSTSGVGDMNGDSVDDLAISAPAGSNGQVGVLFGNTQGFPAEFDLSSLRPVNGGDGSAGFLFGGSDGLPGWSVAHAGDVNDDGLDDLIFGTIDYGPSNNGRGRAVVIYGRDNGFPARITANQVSPPTGFVIVGVNHYDDFGTSVSGAGDINGDGIDDMIVGAPYADPDGNNDAGQSYVIFGNSQGFPGVFDAADLLVANAGDGTAGFVINGIAASDNSGTSVSGAGDVDSDGIDDLIVGAFGARAQGGDSYVLFGSDQGLQAEFDLASLPAMAGGNGTEGFVLRGAFQSGRWVGSAGDINADGLADLIVASPPGGAQLSLGTAGQTYIVFGRQDPDRDGVVHAIDNCTQAYNPSQADIDADGFGIRCDADFNDDCFVNFVDLQMLGDNFFTSIPNFDLDESGSVDFGDLSLMSTLFFAPPGPTSQPNFCP